MTKTLGFLRARTVLLRAIATSRLIEFLKNAKRAIFTAASHAQRAADFLHRNLRPLRHRAHDWKKHRSFGIDLVISFDCNWHCTGPATTSRLSTRWPWLRAPRHRSDRPTTSMSSAILRRCSARLPVTIASSMQWPT